MPNDAAFDTVAQWLINRVRDRASGAADERCVGDLPRDRYFIGCLAPEQTDPKPAATKYSPTAMALTVKLGTVAGEHQLRISARWSVYYRVFPTYAEQTAEALPAVPASEEPEAETDAEPDAAMDSGRHESPESPSEVVVAFRRLDVNVPEFLAITPSADDGADRDAGVAALAGVMHTVRERVAGDPDTIRLREGRVPPVPPTALQSEAAFRNWLKAVKAETPPHVPAWTPGFTIETRVHHEDIRVTIRMENRAAGTRTPVEDLALYCAYLKVTPVTSALAPFHFNLLPDTYAAKRNLWGHGTNCSVKPIERDGTVLAVETEYAPLFRQPRPEPPSLPGTELTFATLAADPIPLLERVLAQMENAARVWERGFPTIGDRTGFLQEVERFRNGIAALSAQPQLLAAFKLLNETFVELDCRRTKPLKAWRLFQLVFVVSLVPDVGSIEYPDAFPRTTLDTADVVWFPTGGGKTEAYLGVVIFSAFFDRLRNKTSGPTAWIRFPLRLLTSQQLQRTANTMVAAEIVRRNHKNLTDDPFSVGFFVGKTSVPNTFAGIPEDALDNPKWLREHYLLVAKCPFCGSRTVEVRADKSLRRLIHHCTQCSETLPLYAIDEEIYRYLPTVVVGTIDKLAVLGTQRRMSLLFGAARSRCPKHGYTNTRWCQVFGCKEPLHPVQLKDTAPSLEVQDELHLLRESMGTFDSHYESLLDTYMETYCGRRLKVVASTATIDDVSIVRQIDHLYRRTVRRFPSKGWADDTSFYSKPTDHAQRYFLGVMPFNKTHIDSMIELIGAVREEREALLRDPAAAAKQLGVTITPDEMVEVLDAYDVKVSYVRSKDDGDLIQRSIRSQLNPRLPRLGVPPVNSRLLIGDTGFDEVQDILDGLEHPAPSVAERIDAVTATDTISHGVDVDRLNIVLFYGIPRSTGSYVQISSRAGRRYPGIVIVCYNTIAERDQSQFSTFVKYHQFLLELVEAVPIDRWSRYSLSRTFPGAFLGVLLNYFSPRLYRQLKNELHKVDTVRSALQRKVLLPDELRRLMHRVYRTSEPDGKVFRAEVDERTIRHLRQIEAATSPYVHAAVRPAAMISLRDVDDQIEFEETSE